MKLTKNHVSWLVQEGHCVAGGSEEYYNFNASKLMADGKLSPVKYKELAGVQDEPNTVKTALTDLNGTLGELKDLLTTEKETDMSAEKLFEGRNIRVKDASEQYSEKRYTAKNKRGDTVTDPIYQRECLSMSEGSKARAGVLLKHLANRCGVTNNPLSEHERSLLDDVCQKHTWAGKVSGEYYDAVSGHRNVKSLIDDATSGGLEIVPIEFDSDVISFPLLNGELFPLVDLHPVPRGRRIEGASIQTPTMTWGGVDGTDIALFNTASMVAAIDTTIFVIDGCVEIGRDFLSDSPVNVGSVLTALIGDRLATELDKVVANGNGTTQPTGLFQSSGVTTVSVDHSVSGPLTLNDFMTLLFTLGKQYRQQQYNVSFISNDTTYQRSRAIKIDTATPSTDQRSVFDPLMSNYGAGVNAYNTLGWAHKVQNDLTNPVCGIAALKKYRMYRRLGLDLRFEQGGYTLARQNAVLLVYRARFGGKLMDANAFAKWTSGQA